MHKIRTKHHAPGGERPIPATITDGSRADKKRNNNTIRKGAKTMLNVSKPTYKKYLSWSNEEITATGEIIDIIEGVLIDNYLLQDDDGNYIILREYPRNTWTSGHEKITGNAASIWKIWDEMTAERDAEEVTA